MIPQWKSVWDSDSLSVAERAVDKLQIRCLWAVPSAYLYSMFHNVPQVGGKHRNP